MTYAQARERIMRILRPAMRRGLSPAAAKARLETLLPYLLTPADRQQVPPDPFGDGLWRVGRAPRWKVNVEEIPLG